MEAIFLGSFNPPHKGHRNVILSVLNYFNTSKDIKEENKINKIYIIPCWQNPNKKENNNYWHRYNMCKLNFSFSNLECGNINVYVDDIETYFRPEYTYKLINFFHSDKDIYIKKDFWWIITQETLLEMINGEWKNGHNLIKDNKFIIFTGNNKYIDLRISDYFSEIKKPRNEIIQIPWIYECNIHSSNIREYYKNNEDISPYVNIGVKTYIQDKNLYK